MSALRPYADYVRASDTLVVGINVEGTVGLTSLIWGAVTSQSQFDQLFNMLFAPMQKHHVLLENLDITQWGANGGPTAVYCAAITDFAHWSDVADAVAQSFQEAGFYTSGQAATVTAYVQEDITQPEAQKFTSAAAKVTTPPGTSPLSHLTAGLSLPSLPDLGNPFATSGQMWFLLIAGLAIILLKKK